MYKKLTILLLLLMPAMTFGTGSNSVLGKRPAPQTELPGQPRSKRSTQDYFMIGNQKFPLNRNQSIAQSTSVTVVNHNSRDQGSKNELAEQPKYHFISKSQGIVGLSTELFTPPIILEQSIGLAPDQLFIDNGFIKSFNGMKWNLAGKLIKAAHEPVNQEQLETSLFEYIEESLSPVLDDVSQNGPIFVEANSGFVVAINPVDDSSLVLENSFGLDTSLLFVNEYGFFQYDNDRLWDNLGKELIVEESSSSVTQQPIVQQKIVRENNTKARGLPRLVPAAPLSTSAKINYLETNKKTSFQCPHGKLASHCTQTFLNEVSIRDHLKNDHKDKNKWVCTYAGCEKRYQRSNDVQDHENSTHLGKKCYFCSECFINFPIATCRSTKRHRNNCSLQYKLTAQNMLVLDEPHFAQHSSENVYYLSPTRGTICLEKSVSLYVTKFIENQDGSFSYTNKNKQISWDQTGKIDQSLFDQELQEENNQQLINPEIPEPILPNDREDSLPPLFDVLESELSRSDLPEDEWSKSLGASWDVSTQQGDTTDISNLVSSVDSYDTSNTPTPLVSNAETFSIAGIEDLDELIGLAQDVIEEESMSAGNTHAAIAENNQSKTSHVPKIFACHHEGCVKKFKQKQALNEHVDIVHLNKKIHFCKVCYQNFAWRKAMSNHVAKCKPVGTKAKDWIFVAEEPTLVKDSNGDIRCLDPRNKAVILDGSQDFDLAKMTIQPDGSIIYNNYIAWNSNGQRIDQHSDHNNPTK